MIYIVDVGSHRIFFMGYKTPVRCRFDGEFDSCNFKLQTVCPPARYDSCSNPKQHLGAASESTSPPVLPILTGPPKSTISILFSFSPKRMRRTDAHFRSGSIAQLIYGSMILHFFLEQLEATQTGCMRYDHATHLWFYDFMFFSWTIGRQPDMFACDTIIRSSVRLWVCDNLV